MPKVYFIDGKAKIVKDEHLEALKELHPDAEQGFYFDNGQGKKLALKQNNLAAFHEKFPNARQVSLDEPKPIDASFGLNDIPGVKERLDKAKPIESQEQYVKGLLEPNKTRPQQEALTEYARTASPMTSIFETKKGNIVVPTNDKEQFQKQNPEAKEVNLSKSPGELYKEEQVNIARQKGELLETLSSKIDEFDTKYSELLASQAIQLFAASVIPKSN